MNFITSIASIVLTAQSAAPAITVPPPPSSAPQPPSELPIAEVEDPYADCRCDADGAEKVDAEFTGLVKDAQTFLAEDGRSIAERQATIFSVIDGLDAKMVKVFHSTKPSKCGITFNYGKQYEVSVRSLDGDYTTSYCIDPRRFKNAQ